MNYIYLNMFDSLFFNVENRDDVKSAIEGVNSVLSSLIIKYGEVVNEIAAGTSGQGTFVDSVVCLFSRKIMEQLDAINILYSSCSFSQAQLILR